MMTKKYKLGEKHPIENLYPIIALKDFGNVNKGDVGGWVESENNLSQEGNCWIYDDAWVYGNAQVCDNARVYDYAHVYGNARVFDDAEVYDSARVSGDARVYDNAHAFSDCWIYDDARVYDYALVYGNAQVYGNAWVFDDARVYDNAKVYGNARVYDRAQVYGNVRVCSDADVGGNDQRNNTTITEGAKNMIDYDSDAGAWEQELSRTQDMRKAQKQETSPYGFIIVPEVDGKGEYYAVYSGHTEIAELQDYIGAFRNTKYRNLPNYLWEPADNALLSLNDMETITKLMREIIE